MFDAGYRARAQLGFIVLATERTIEREMVQLAPDGVNVHFARVPMAPDVTVESLRDVGDGLAAAAATLLPDDPPDVISYACTSGSFVLGEDEVAARIRSGAPTARPTSLIAAVVRGLHAVGATRVTLVTPYIEELNALEVAYLGQHDIAVASVRGLGLLPDREMSRVAPAFLRDVVVETDTPEADAVLVSCGALRTLDLIDDLERTLGKPVVTSNQALMWDALRLAGVDDELSGLGRLFSA